MLTDQIENVIVVSIADEIFDGDEAVFDRKNSGFR
jgi:hypothetical protein